MTKLLYIPKYFPYKKKIKLKILYIPNGEYVECPFFEFGIGHFYVERYKEKRLKFLAQRCSELSRSYHKHFDENLPKNHDFYPSEFELILVEEE